MFFRNDPEAESYVPPRIAEPQLRELEDHIRRSRDASPFAKRVVIWMLRQTDGLTRAVSLSMSAEFCSGTAREVQDAAHDLCSANGSTHLDEFMKRMGTEVGLEHHSGAYRRRADGATSNDFGQREDGSRTIWWSHIRYDHIARKLDLPTRDALAAIPLE